MRSIGGVALLVALVVVVTDAGMVGGWSKLDINSPKVKKILIKANQQLTKLFDSDFKFITVVKSAKQQVIS